MHRTTQRKRKHGSSQSCSLAKVNASCYRDSVEAHQTVVVASSITKLQRCFKAVQAHRCVCDCRSAMAKS